MAENYYDNRKRNFKFPVYDDEVGVKISGEDARVLFQDEHLLTEKTKRFEETFQNKEENKETKKEVKKTFRRERFDHVQEDKQSPKSFGVKEAPTKNLFKTREQPSFLKEKQSTSNQAMRTNVVGGARTSKLHERPTKSYRVEEPVLQTNSSGRNQFVPTYVPPSTIKEEHDLEIPVERKDLVSSMKKSEDSYLLFESKRKEPSILTKQAYRHSDTVTEEERIEDLSQNNETLFSGEKKNERSQTPYEKKQQKKKSFKLDRSLSGMIEEEKPNVEGQYFE